MTKREIAFVLSLSATIASPTFLWFSLWQELRPVITLSLIAPITLMMITGLLFMGISKTERGRIIGGIIILIMGLVFLMMFLTTIRVFFFNTCCYGNNRRLLRNTGSKRR